MSQGYAEPVELLAHTFRHTVGHGPLRRGVPAEVVQELLGHASVTTMTRRADQHLKIEDIRRVLDGWMLGCSAMGGETGTGEDGDEHAAIASRGTSAGAVRGWTGWLRTDRSSLLPRF